MITVDRCLLEFYKYVGQVKKKLSIYIVILMNGHYMAINLQVSFRVYRVHGLAMF